MRVKRCGIVVSLLSMFLGLLSYVFVGAASASTTYDDDYKVVDHLRLYSNFPSAQCPFVDYDDSWETILSDSANWPYSGEYNIHHPRIQQAIESGTLSLSLLAAKYSFGAETRVIIKYSTQPASLNWIDGEILLQTPTNGTTGTIEMLPERSLFGYGDCDPVLRYVGSGYPISNDTGQIETTDIPEVDTAQMAYTSFNNFFTKNVSPNYPVGYDGEIVRSEPPIPPTMIYNGSVDCGVDSLEYMLITQDGDTDPVTLSYESAYRASWSHYLTNSSYTITVGCGSELAASYAPVTPMPPTSNDWICDTVNDPHYCVLS